MKKVLFYTFLCVALVGGMLTSCESEQSPMTDNTKLWPAFSYNEESGEVKYGYINSKGEWAIQPIYDVVGTFSNGVAPVAIYNEETDELVYSYIDKNGNQKGAFAYANHHYCGLAVASYDGDIYGFVDASADFKISPMYEDVDDFSDDLARYNDETADGYGFINKKGEVEISAMKLAMYDGIGDFSEELARVRIDDKYGFINKKAEQVIPLTYDYVSRFSDGLATYEMGSKCGFINKKGEMEIPAMYDDVYYFFEDGLAPVEMNGKWGFINKKGDMKIKPMFDDAYSFCEGMALVEINDKIGFIDTKGDLIIPAIYDDVLYSEYFHNGLIAVCTETETSATYSYINKKGETIWSLTIKYGSDEETLSVRSKKNDSKKAFLDKKLTNHYMAGSLRK